MLTVESVKVFLNDFPEVNKLIKKDLFSPDRIRLAMKFVVDEWNEKPPILSKYTVETFPYNLTLLYGVASWLFAGEATAEARNHLVYQSGGLAVNDSENASTYTTFSNFFSAKFKDLMEMQKKEENINLCWGTVGSGYFSS